MIFMAQRDLISMTEGQLRSLVREAANYMKNGGQHFSPRCTSTLMVEVFNDVLVGRKRLNAGVLRRMEHWLEAAECAFIPMKWSAAPAGRRIGEEARQAGDEERAEPHRVLLARLLVLRYGVSKVRGVQFAAAGAGCEAGNAGCEAEVARFDSESAYFDAEAARQAAEAIRPAAEAAHFDAEAIRQTEGFFVVNVQNKADFFGECVRLADVFGLKAFYYKPLDCEDGCEVVAGERRGASRNFVRVVCDEGLARFREGAAAAALQASAAASQASATLGPIQLFENYSINGKNACAAYARKAAPQQAE